MFLTEKFKSATVISLFIFNTSLTIELIVPPDEKIPIVSPFFVSFKIYFSAFTELNLNFFHGIIPSIIISFFTHLCKKYLNPNINFSGSLDYFQFYLLMF